MKALKRNQKESKAQRERRVLLGLVGLYIREGKPVGSKRLREAGFQELSSATLRNYFANLEKEGFLAQQHSSGGRLPTPKAFRIYALYCLEECSKGQPTLLNEEQNKTLEKLRKIDTAEIRNTLEEGAELLSKLSHSAVFLSAPRFDHDFVQDLKIVSIDQQRCLCIIVTSFGLIKTEVLRTENKLTAFALKRIESYFHWRLTGQAKPETLSKEEHDLAQKFYNEALVRYIVGYSNFSDEEIHCTGFSQLLNYADYNEVSGLAGALALFENPHAMRLLLRECMTANEIKIWIGDELPHYSNTNLNSAVITIPYKIGPKAVGAIGILGPMRVPYKEMLELLKHFSDAISESLTKSIYRFGINYRQPLHQPPTLKHEQLLLEDKTHKSQ